MSLAQQGFAVVNFSYRLASKYKFPAPLEDTNRVFVWLLAHAVRYGFDTHNVFGVGDNAGVHLLALYGACCTNPAYAALFTVRPPAGFVPWAVALNCGVYCVEMSNKKDLTTRLMADYLPGKGTAEELERMDVFSHLTAAFPPAFVMTAEGNFLAPQAGLLAERLQAVGARAEYHYCGDAGHVLGHVFHCNISSEYARCCNREGCDFFKAWRGERGSFHQSIQNEPASAFVWWCTNSGALLLQKNVRT